MPVRGLCASPGGGHLPLIVVTGWCLRRASAPSAGSVRADEVAAWLGHPNINVTYATYGHLVPSSLGRAQEVLNSEYTQWSKAA